MIQFWFIGRKLFLYLLQGSLQTTDGCLWNIFLQALKFANHNFQSLLRLVSLQPIKNLYFAKKKITAKRKNWEFFLSFIGYYLHLIYFPTFVFFVQSVTIRSMRCWDCNKYATQELWKKTENSYFFKQNEFSSRKV